MASWSVFDFAIFISTLGRLLALTAQAFPAPYYADNARVGQRPSIIRSSEPFLHGNECSSQFSVGKVYYSRFFCGNDGEAVGLKCA
jgi:hypothetical protein